MNDDGIWHDPQIYDGEIWPTVDNSAEAASNVYMLPIGAQDAGAPDPAAGLWRDAPPTRESDLWARHVLALCSNPIIGHLFAEATSGVGCALTTSDDASAMLRCAAYCDGAASVLAVSIEHHHCVARTMGTLARLREANPELPVLLMADAPRMSLASHDLSEVCDLFLPLPATPSRLRSGLQTAVLNTEERIAV